VVEITEEEAREGMFGSSRPGICVACGERHDGIEPDLVKGKCYACGKFEVYGMEMAVGAGVVEVEEGEDDVDLSMRGGIEHGILAAAIGHVVGECPDCGGRMGMDMAHDVRNYAHLKPNARLIEWRTRGGEEHIHLRHIVCPV
jgi:hypothetical protein